MHAPRHFTLFLVALGFTGISIGAWQFSVPLQEDPLTQEAVAPDSAQVDSLQSRVKQLEDTLQEERYKSLLDQSKSILVFADHIIDWSAMLLTFFVAFVGLVAAVATFLGIREYKGLRTLRDQLAKDEKELIQKVETSLGESTDKLVESTQDFERKIQDQTKTFEDAISELKTRMESDMKTQKDTFTVLMREEIKEVSSTFEKSYRELEAQLLRDSKTLVDVSYNLSEADQAYKVGDYNKAIKHFTEVDQLKPNESHVLCRLGRAYTNIGDNDSAIRSFQRVIEHYGEHARALRGLGIAHRYTDSAAAISYITRATDADPTDHEIWDYLGLLYRDIDKIDEAIQAHQEALSIRKRPETYFFLALLYSAQSKQEEAIESINAAIHSLTQAEEAKRIRPVWAAIIGLGHQILTQDWETARTYGEELRPHVTTHRMQRAILGHIEYLLSQTQQRDEIEYYRSLFNTTN